jgi:two-component system sensor histidine kinase TctE
MERQRTFLDDASHQLRTPLATLHAQVGYAMRQDDPREAVNTLGSIADQLDHATRSTNQLLALARNDATALVHERFDLDDLVREVATRLLPLARAKNLDFGVEPGIEPCIAEGDRQLLSEAATNLAHNAVSYTPDRGQVTLTAVQDAEGFEIRVSNSGQPIPEAVVLRLGERFVKGDASRGAGLGLAIAKSIVERHGGTLGVTRLEASGLNCVSMRGPRSAVRT